MRPPRLSIRGLMALVLGFGIALHVGISAVRVHAAKEFHGHSYVVDEAGATGVTVAPLERPPFWPRYWRCLLGRPWRRQALCRPVEGRLLDMCEFAHPEIRKRTVGGIYMISTIPAQDDLARRISDRSH